MPHFTFWKCSICGAKVYVGRLRAHLDWHLREGVPVNVVAQARETAARLWRQ
jgi:hypothetical protein